jgi:hypothetical protein
MAGIFVSYRQADAKAWAISLRDDLAEVFGGDQVFLDKDTLHAGNWRHQIQTALDRCKVALIVIGPRWLSITDDQNRPRIHLADDVHHQEVALALSRPDVIVIPVLVDEASMPRREHLPEDLRKLCDQQARKIGDTQGRRKADLDILIRDIEAVGGIHSRARSEVQTHSGSTSWPASWFNPAWATVGIPVALTLLFAIYYYQSNMPLETRETLFLLLVFYSLSVGAKWLWNKLLRQRRGAT